MMIAQGVMHAHGQRSTFSGDHEDAGLAAVPLQPIGIHEIVDHHRHAVNSPSARPQAAAQSPDQPQTMAQCSQGKQRAPQRNPSSSQPDIKIRVDAVFRVRQRGQKVLKERMIAERGHRLIASDKH
ncbi:MAG: hypothetical protein N2B03_07155, partial [Boseongicola sp.]